MGMYDGEIYKTQNLRNLSMMQMYPDEDDLKAARDSIDRRLRSFGKDLWVPDRDEYLAQRAAAEAAAEAAAAGDTIPSATTTVTEDDDEPKSAKSVRSSKRKRAKAKSSKPKQPKQPKVKQSSGNSNAAKSVRRRKR
jgi:hypothetical protein